MATHIKPRRRFIIWIVMPIEGGYLRKYKMPLNALSMTPKEPGMNEKVKLMMGAAAPKSRATWNEKARLAA